MPVLAIAREDVVVWFEREDAADHGGLLAQVEMAVAADLRARVLVLGALLEAPDELHLAVQAEEVVAVLLLELEALGRDAAGLGRRLHCGHRLIIHGSRPRRAGSLLNLGLSGAPVGDVDGPSL